MSDCQQPTSLELDPLSNIFHVPDISNSAQFYYHESARPYIPGKITLVLSFLMLAVHHGNLQSPFHP
jgi:hypothetical protein